MNDYAPVKPYLMCTRQECEDRERTNEVSIFERKPNGRTLDPCSAVSKYRRSAAGFTDKERAVPRSLEKLEVTVHYLVSFLASTNPVGSYLQRVQFVEDRLRAVQVDLVLTQIASKELQHSMARLQLLVLYLLIDTPDYLQKFGDEALHTALSSYWNDPRPGLRDDEMLSYAIFVQCREYLKGLEQGSGTPSISGIQATCRKCAGDRLRNLPLVQWSLELTVNLALGHWQKALCMLSEPQTERKCPQFFVFARCCLASSLPWLRWKTLECFNFAWRKGEKVEGSELARLLHIVPTNKSASAWDDSKEESTEARAALELGQSLGLPLDDETRSKLLFKVAPLRPLAVSRLVRRDDGFVFGRNGPECRVEDGIVLPDEKWTRDLILGTPVI